MKWRNPFRRQPNVQQGRVRKFEAARIDRLTSEFIATSASIDRELRSDLDSLRARSRHLKKNNEYAKKFTRMVRNNIAGPQGFTLQAKVMDSPDRPDDLANKAIETGWAEWSKKGVCEVSGRYSFPDVERLLADTAATDGEFLVRIVLGRAAGNRFGFALQVLDVERLATRLNRAPARGHNAINMGVEVDAMRRPVAYHIHVNHPNDMHGAGQATERIPASQIIHAFMPDYAEQTRGIPWLHAVILRLHEIGGYRSAAVIAARVGASQMGIITSPDGTVSGLETGEGSGGEPEIEIEPGTFPVLPEGYGMTPFNPDYPHEQFADFMKECLRGIASGAGVSYNSLGNNLEGVNFSSIRSGVLEERDEWVGLQNWFSSSLHSVIFPRWLEMSLLRKALVFPNGSPLPDSKLDKYSPHSFQGRRWAWVDPKKDIEAQLLAISHGLTSPQRVAASMGIDVSDVLDELKRFQDMVREKDVELPRSKPTPDMPPAATSGDE